MAKNVYLGFLRGINVGGNSLIKMDRLKVALADGGLEDVRTYIQSGNVLFSSETKDADKLARLIEGVIQKQFDLDVKAVVFSKTEWQDVIKAAPDWWGTDDAQRHNLLIMLRPADPNEVVTALGDLKSEVETMLPGKSVLYWSYSMKLYSRSSARKLIMSPVYKKMTIRNYNTATKLLALLD